MTLTAMLAMLAFPDVNMVPMDGLMLTERPIESFTWGRDYRANPDRYIAQVHQGLRSKYDDWELHAKARYLSLRSKNPVLTAYSFIRDMPEFRRPDMWAQSLALFTRTLLRRGYMSPAFDVDYWDLEGKPPSEPIKPGKFRTVHDAYQMLAGALLHNTRDVSARRVQVGWARAKFPDDPALMVIQAELLMTSVEDVLQRRKGHPQRFVRESRETDPKQALALARKAWGLAPKSPGIMWHVNNIVRRTTGPGPDRDAALRAYASVDDYNWRRKQALGFRGVPSLAAPTWDHPYGDEVLPAKMREYKSGSVIR